MIRLTVLVTLCIALVGCSSKFVYNNIDWLLVEFVEDYVELDDNQEKLVSHKISMLTQWHRQEEIPNYIEHLDELIAIEPALFTQDDLERQQEKFQNHSIRLIERISPDALVIAQQLDDEQVNELMDSIRVKHMEYKEKYLGLTEDEFREVYYERVEDSLQTWLGKLTKQQKKMINQWASEVYITRKDWTNYQTTMRIQLVNLLNSRMIAEQFQPKFDQIMFNPDSYYSDELADKIEHNRAVGNRYLIQIINSMTEKQTEHYRDELRDWRELAVEVIS